MKVNEFIDQDRTDKDIRREKFKNLQNNMHKLIDENFERKMKAKKKKLPLSLLHTKLELPILYSNLISIEDMKYENSNYFISTNGYLTSSVRVIFSILNCS